MIDDETVERVRRHWDDGWNGEDVAVIMAPFASDIVFSSPFVGRVSGEPDRTTIEGADALQAYVEHALRRTPGIRYTVDAAYAGTDHVLLVYTCFLPDGRVKRGADTMRIDPSGQIAEWRCHYTVESLD